MGHLQPQTMRPGSQALSWEISSLPLPCCMLAQHVLNRFKCNCLQGYRKVSLPDLYLEIWQWLPGTGHADQCQAHSNPSATYH